MPRASMTAAFKNQIDWIPLRDRVVGVMEELFRYTLLFRDHVAFLHTRYSEDKEKREHGKLEPALGVVTGA